MTDLPELRDDVLQAYGQSVLDIDLVVRGVTEEVRVPFACELDSLDAPVVKRSPSGSTTML